MTAPYLRDLPAPACEQCGRRAQVILVDGAHRDCGTYCRACGPEARERLDLQEFIRGQPKIYWRRPKEAGP